MAADGRSSFSVAGLLVDHWRGAWVLERTKRTAYSPMREYPILWTPNQLDAIERRYPSREVHKLVSEIRRVNAMATLAGQLVRALDYSPDSATTALVATALRERLQVPVTR